MAAMNSLIGAWTLSRKRCLLASNHGRSLCAFSSRKNAKKSLGKPLKPLAIAVPFEIRAGKYHVSGVDARKARQNGNRKSIRRGAYWHWPHTVPSLNTDFSFRPAGRNSRIGMLRARLFFGISVFLLFGSFLALVFTLRDLGRSSTLVAHCYNVMDTTDSLLSTLEDTETGQRRFRPAPRAHFLAPFITTVPQVRTQLAQLRSLLADTAEKKDRRR